MDEPRDRARGEVPTFDAYLAQRRKSGIVYPMIGMTEAAYGFEVSRRAYGTHPLPRMIEGAVDVVNSTNDVYSLEKEVSRGDVHNLVLVLERERGGPRAERGGRRRVDRAVVRGVRRDGTPARRRLRGHPSHRGRDVVGLAVGGHPALSDARAGTPGRGGTPLSCRPASQPTRTCCSPCPVSDLAAGLVESWVVVGRGEAIDRAWARIEPLLPPVSGGWRELPERYGPWKTAHERLWLETGPMRILPTSGQTGDNPAPAGDRNARTRSHYANRVAYYQAELTVAAAVLQPR